MLRCVAGPYPILWLSRRERAGNFGCSSRHRDRPFGSILTSAAVSLTSNDTGLTRQTSSDNKGAYSFHDLPIGVYSLVFTKEGFDTQNYPAIQVQANRTATLNAQLRTGQVSSSVTVNGTPLMNATDTTNGYVPRSSRRR